MKNLADSLEITLKSSDLQGTASGLAEVALDTFIDEGIARDIPIIGTLFGMANTVSTVRDHLFLKKIVTFLTELSSVDMKQRAKMLANIENDEKYKTKVGEKLLFILDRCDDYEKAQLIAKLFCAFVNEEIKYDDFLRCSAIIERVFLTDIYDFVDSTWDYIETDNAPHLLNTGLVDLSIPDFTVEENPDYKASETYVVNDASFSMWVSKSGTIIRKILVR
ncbi:TPA: hypothetical protein ACN36C_004572 [Vibrio parahaemolyticus]